MTRRLHDSPGDRRYCHLGPDHILRFSRFAFSRTRLRRLTARGDHRRLYDSIRRMLISGRISITTCTGISVPVFEITV